VLLVLLAWLGTATAGCAAVVEQREVRGESLKGLVEAGTTLQIETARGCIEPRRGDLVTWRPAKRDTPVVKVVRAVPGDTLALLEEEGIFYIHVNDERLTTSTGEPYALKPNRARMLQLYEGELRADTFLLLGNIAGGTYDSTRLGLIHKSDIEGRVISGVDARP